MYQQETITKELHLQLSDEDLAQFEQYTRKRPSK